MKDRLKRKVRSVNANSSGFTSARGEGKKKRPRRTMAHHESTTILTCSSVLIAAPHTMRLDNNSRQ